MIDDRHSLANVYRRPDTFRTLRSTAKSNCDICSTCVDNVDRDRVGPARIMGSSIQFVPFVSAGDAINGPQFPATNEQSFLRPSLLQLGSAPARHLLFGESPTLSSIY